VTGFHGFREFRFLGRPVITSAWSLVKYGMRKNAEFKNVEMFAEWWVKCGMLNLEYNCLSDISVNLQIVQFLDACCAILMY